MINRIIIALVAAGALFGAVWWLRADAYDDGFKAAQSASAMVTITENNKAVIEKVKNERLFNSIPVLDLDNYIAGRGWMRPIEDR